MADIGYWALFLSLIVSLYGAIASFVGARQTSRRLVESAKNAILVIAVLVTLASVILLYLLVTHEFQVKYVYQYTSTHLPLVYTISAFWAGQEGSLLLWLWFLAILAAVVAQYGERRGKMGPYLLAILTFTEAFFALLLISISNPFETYPSKPPEGVGMLPLLENPGMIFHPPVLFLGYAGYTVPFAFALAILMSGELSADWVKAVRRWNLFAWLSLGAGILIGAWWSYVELGWGGYWAWDPVENASLIPWLIGTVFLHSAMMEERRGMHKVWNMVLPTLSFVLCLFATLVTRGGIIVSDLHGFSRSLQPIAYFLLAFIALALGSSSALIYHRRRQLGSEREMESLLSREGSFLLNNLLLCGVALIVLLGTTYPTLTQALRGVQVSLDLSFYNRGTGPLAMVLICLMGICPIIAWRRLTTKSIVDLLRPAIAALVLTTVAFIVGVRGLFPLISIAVCAFVTLSLLGVVIGDLMARHRSTGENYPKALFTLISKARRRYGGYLVHLGIILIAIGVTGSMAYKSEKLVALSPGESTTIHGYTLRYEDYTIEELNPEPETYQSRVRFSTTLAVYGGDSKLAILVPEKNYHWVLDNPWVTEVAIRSNLKEDLYVILASLDETGLAAFQIIINPLVIWIWIGSGLLLVGTLIAVWPTRRRTTEEG
jgi:cytochrome c-type biogenesis protein CcmF